MWNRGYLAYLGCSLSVGVFSAFNNFTLSIWLTGLTGSYVLISLLGNTRSFEGAIVSPLTGAWSDRIWAGWLGRRRPFILVGGLLSALLLALTPAISRLAPPDGLPEPVARLAAPVTAIFLFTLTFNLMDDIHKALLPDIADDARRDRLSAISVVVDMGSQVIILAVLAALWAAAVSDAAFVLTGAIVAAGILVTVLGVREPPPAAWAAARAAEPAGARLSPRALVQAYRGAAILGLAGFCYWSGVSAVMPLVSIYCVDILGATVGEAQILPALLLLSTTLLAVPAGRLGAKLGRRRVISAGYIVMGMAALGGLFITTKEQGALLFLAAGAGNAAIMVLTLPFLAELVPPHHMGAATGVLAAAGSLAAPLTSLLAGGLAGLYGPRVVFAVMAVGVVAALLLIQRIQVPTAGEAAPRPAGRPAPVAKGGRDVQPHL
jgi:MFS family permease